MLDLLTQERWALLTVALVFGALIGSFLNVVIYRLPAMMERDWENELALAQDKEPVQRGRFNLVTPRSRCGQCGHVLTALENIPIVSWLVLRGKCSACRTRISVRYPLVELATAMGPGWGCIMSNFLPKGSPMAHMKEIGKVGITVELGGRSATSPKEFARVGRELADSILNILRHYKMYPGTAEYPDPRYIGEQEALLAPASGIFLPAPGVEFLTMMKKGDPIARIVNIFGDTLAKLVATADGMFFGLRALPNVQTGDWCCFFCKVSGTRD